MLERVARILRTASLTEMRGNGFDVVVEAEVITVPKEEDGPLGKLSLRTAVLTGTILSELEVTGKGEEVAPIESLEVCCALDVAIV